MLVVLRMNRVFMQYMRDHYGYLSRQTFRMALVSEHENESRPEVTKPYKKQRAVPPKPPAQPNQRLDAFFLSGRRCASCCAACRLAACRLACRAAAFSWPIVALVTRGFSWHIKLLWVQRGGWKPGV